MLPRQRFSRIDLLELKAHIIGKIGRQKAEKYFDQLKRLFSLKLSKCEFDKSCVRLIGKENVPLHNRLIGSIVKNAYFAKVPPEKARKECSLNVKIANGYQRNCLQSLYGDAFPPSPRKCRSLVSRDRKFRDRPSPLGPLGKPQSVMCEESISRAQEQQSATELLSLGSRPPGEIASVEDGEEVEQVAGSPSVQSRSPVTAPLGISVTMGGARKSLCNGLACNLLHLETCHSSGELPDSRTLRSRLEQKLEMKGIRITVDCVNLLNNGLDAYLKRLIEPCIRVAGSKHRSKCFNPSNGRTTAALNGALPGRYLQLSNNSLNATMLDFRAAMELNPQILGEDWAIQLENICLRETQE
ncbi:uncharacterized protein LOC131155333 [Malania oleifera]|uniref:uncharacterized protein LOC131155333 n=1 Tax=Malania oleifera TaxID=397392 RepID=UPI0025AE2496|nr:uncharacterized protein LOC131155333 [Malania oleifera]